MGVKVFVGVKVTVNAAEAVNVPADTKLLVTVGLKVTVFVIDGVGDISPPVFGMRTVEVRRSTATPPKNRNGKPKPSKQTARNITVITVKLLSFNPTLLLLNDPAPPPQNFHISR